MVRLRALFDLATTALVYFAAATLSICLFRFDGGIAEVWLASPVLVARLIALPRASWLQHGLVAALAGAVATGLFGLGWVVALPLTAINLAEAVGSALVARHLLQAHWPDDPLDFVAGCYLGLGLGVPLVAALFTAGANWALLGASPGPTFVHAVVGHGVGLAVLLPLTLPIALAFRRDDVPADDEAWVRFHVRHPRITPGRLVLRVSIFVGMLALSAAAFSQQTWPGLVLVPFALAMLAGLLLDAVSALALPTAIALAGGVQTWLGRGPIALFHADVGDRVQMLLIYSALVMICTLPVVCEQERRRRELRNLAGREAHYRQQAAEADDLIQRLTRAAFTDSLTGLANRRAFFDQMRGSVGRGDTDCIAIIDIDHFKQVNDRYGHVVGDEALRIFARTAQQAVRASDCLARIGGEEFAILMRGTTVELAERICERLGRRIAETGIPVPDGEIRVTISTGIAALAGDADRAFVAADAALYRAKNAGRSRLEVAA